MFLTQLNGRFRLIIIKPWPDVVSLVRGCAVCSANPSWRCIAFLNTMVIIVVQSVLMFFLNFLPVLFSFLWISYILATITSCHWLISWWFHFFFVLSSERIRPTGCQQRPNGSTLHEQERRRISTLETSYQKVAKCWPGPTMLSIIILWWYTERISMHNVRCMHCTSISLYCSLYACTTGLLQITFTFICSSFSVWQSHSRILSFSLSTWHMVHCCSVS